MNQHSFDQLHVYYLESQMGKKSPNKQRDIDVVWPHAYGENGSN